MTSSNFETHLQFFNDIKDDETCMSVSYDIALYTINTITDALFERHLKRQILEKLNNYCGDYNDEIHVYVYVREGQYLFSFCNHCLVYKQRGDSLERVTDRRVIDILLLQIAKQIHETRRCSYRLKQRCFSTVECIATSIRI